jgi:hypothetical protein
MITLAASDCCPGSFEQSCRAVRARFFDRGDIPARLAMHPSCQSSVAQSLKTETAPIAGRTQRGDVTLRCVAKKSLWLVKPSFRP